MSRLVGLRSLAVLVGWLASAGAQQAPLAVVQGSGPDAFGSAVRVAGDVDADGVADYVVGAPEADPGGVSAAGQAWVFSGADHSLLFRFDGTTLNYRLGRSVDGAGDVNGDGHADVIVGEPASSTSATTPGRAWVFSGLDGGVLHAFSGTDLLGDFGTAVAGLGDVDGDGVPDVAVGAPDEGGFPEVFRGSITIFSGADGEVILKIPGGAQHGQLGSSLAAAGDLNGDDVPDLVAGDSSWNGGGVVLLSGATGSLLLGAMGPSDLDVGRTSGLLGDLNADGYPDFYGGGDDVVMIWSGVDASLLQAHELWSSSSSRPVAADLGDVDGDGHDDVLIGDPEAPVLNSAGMVLAVSGADGSVLMVQRGWTTQGRFGTSLAVLGDGDSDGRPEFLVGQPFGGTGQVYTHEFEPGPEPSVVLSGPKPEGFGTVVRSAGDVDNDGAPDVIAGEPYDGTAAFDAGRATVFSGRDGAVIHELLGAATIDRLGWSVDAAGDVDRDGHADLVVGAPFRSFPLPGAAYLYSGKTGVVLHEFHGVSHGDRFGMSVGGVGDVDGDGAPDVLIGAPFDDTAASDAGAARLYSGATGQLLAAFLGSAVQSAFGFTVGGGGDVDGDGRPDLLIGVPNDPIGNPPSFPGTVRAYSGATGVLLHTLVGEPGWLGFGRALDDAGDVDGDGHDDIVAGMANGNGRVTLHSGATGSQLLEIALSSNGDALGSNVAGGGDVNGDGVPDLLAGASGDDVTMPGEGQVLAFSGVDGSLLSGYVRGVDDGELGVAVDFAGDVDFDGLADVLAGALAGAAEGEGEIVLWVSGNGSSPWANLGGVLPGLTGAPHLFPNGTLLPAQPVTLKLTQARPLAPATLIAGLSQLGAPFKGGTLVPQPTFLIGGLLTNDAGSITLSTSWPAGLPSGTAVHLQYWIVDPTGPAGLTASNGIRGTVP